MSIEFCCTPKQAATGIIDAMQPCPPPPPRAPSEVIEVFVSTQDLSSDKPTGFFLAAPLRDSSRIPSFPRTHSRNKKYKLLPRKSRWQPEHDCFREQITTKQKSIDDGAVRATVAATASKNFEDSYRGWLARSA